MKEGVVDGNLSQQFTLFLKHSLAVVAAVYINGIKAIENMISWRAGSSAAALLFCCAVSYTTTTTTLATRATLLLSCVRLCAQ